MPLLSFPDVQGGLALLSGATAGGAVRFLVRLHAARRLVYKQLQRAGLMHPSAKFRYNYPMPPYRPVPGPFRRPRTGGEAGAHDLSVGGVFGELPLPFRDDGINYVDL
ncbi:hypothetical protein MAPG_04434 [Magnaporthiopsis poae ATCC 64411]|uniref:Uncharacterized protein n=1 Tax=Magnaporthiopsis poae (strain ATCC 64411 / 73-15) TaxID=644358 RepID=A0A0C4DWQ4_MAGP6|nr:hypothetical protein MAPG_04434 [Magnaporthiopsis poae ATCC 64411]